MIKNLQRKFILITMISLLAVLIFLLGSINGVFIYQTRQKADTLLNMLIDNNGYFPKKTGPKNSSSKPFPFIAPQEKKGGFDYPISEETPFETRYFCVWLTGEKVAKTDVGHIASISQDEAISYTKKAQSSHKSTGFLNQFHYKRKKDGSSTLYVFVDSTNSIQTIQNFAFLSCFIGIICVLLVFTLIFFLSKRAIRPIAINMEKQKQFITDAGHEIKTPLSIISANTEVIEMCQGKSEWTESIHNQVNRMNELVQNLLALAKLDEEKLKLSMEDFSIDKILSNIINTFSILIDSKNLKLTTQIQTKVAITGDKKNIERLLSILLDNAVKYSDENGSLEIFLANKEKYIELSIYNSCCPVPQGDLSCLFDRFYRTDASRARESGGYGIGLSVAKSIVLAHQGKITAKQKNDGVIFYILLPKQSKAPFIHGLS